MLRLLPITAFIALVVPALFAGCSDPADPIDMGQLCAPEADDCPDSATLTRDGPGRNSLDLMLHHDGADNGDSTVRIRVTTDEDIDPPDSRSTDEDGALILYDEHLSVSPDETVAKQLDAYHLTVVSELQLQLTCIEGSCDHRLEYLYFADSIECVDTDMCRRNEFCEPAYGRCAECTGDGHCEGEQECLRETGTCYPGETTGCNNAGSGPAGLPWGPAALLVLLGIAAVRIRPRKAALAAAVVCTAALVAPVSASAETGASLNAGGGMRILTGDTGEMTGVGWGINVNQQLRWRRVGAKFELSTNSFPIHSGAPEGSRLSGYAVTVGPRAFIPLPIQLRALGEDEPFELLVAVDYSNWNVAENRLAPTTGLHRRFHGVGPTLGLTWRSGGLNIGARAGYLHLFGWPGDMISLHLTVGIGS